MNFKGSSEKCQSGNYGVALSKHFLTTDWIRFSIVKLTHLH